MLKLAPEGYPFIAAFFLLALLTALVSPAAAVLPLVLALFMIYFFRDPDRDIPQGENLFLSPADGKVILIERGDRIGISIFMSPLDVHVNRAPCDGVVESVVHTPGRFLSAFRHEASLSNEKIEMVLETKHGKILVRQVAGFLARRAVCRVSPGDSLKRGERYGIIKFSSRLDIYLPKDTTVRVRLGEKVKAGETVIGEIP